MSDGFRLEDKQYNLTFEAPQFAGMRVSLTGMSFRKVMDFDDVRFRPVTNTKELNQRTEDTAAVVVEHLVEWNLVDKGGLPTPHTVDGLLSHDQAVFLAIVQAYANALRGVIPAPLDERSTSGEGVASLPTETLPTNLEPTDGPA